jgi:pimeloyl-ACP methyl ester carboxylesterase
MLLHSSGMSSRQFSRLAPKLVEAGYRAVLVDLTGHGKSPPLAEGTPMSWRDDVAEVIALITEPTKIVGHSYGGLIALHAALVAPVTKLVLYDPVAIGILDPVADADVLATLSTIGGATPDAWMCAFVDYWGGAGAWNGLRDNVRDEFRRVAWAVRKGVITLMTDQTKTYPKLPLALLTGELTPIAEQRVVERLAAVTGASITRIAGAGHMGPLSHADVVNARVLELLQ